MRKKGNSPDCAWTLRFRELVERRNRIISEGDRNALKTGNAK